VNVLVLGATSIIAEHVARAYAKRGASLLVVGRDACRLAMVRDDLRVRGASRCEASAVDLDDLGCHARLIEEAEALLGPLDVVLLAQGALGDPAEYVRDGGAVARVLQTNLVAPASLLTLVASRMEARRRGSLAAISSVAGDRGRASNYAYGAAKGGLALFLQGLRNRLQRSGVHVLTVKPGFVDTPMTAALPKNALYAQPETVARDIVRAIDARRDVLYTPWFWRWIMLVVRAIPERVFKRLSL
jgi:decaprenylphospho-beta-D-erythro-pentofuranosid-2-ulose 2-reductase